MRYRTFGTSGLRVSELFLGAMTFSEQGGVGAPASECRRILDAPLDASSGNQERHRLSRAGPPEIGRGFAAPGVPVRRWPC
jgi:hypothetical protein